MNLKNYFQDKKDFKLLESNKLALYEKIMLNKEKSTSRHPLFEKFSIKSFIYGFITVILLSGIYGVYIFDGNNNGIHIQTNTVNANYIAKIIDFNGDFYIKHDGKLYKTNSIQNGDNIILRKDSEIIFDINSGTKAKIIGPAKLSIKQILSGYQLEISEGEYIQMESIPESENQNMEILIGDFSISSDNEINLLITKSNNEYKINNQGDSIMVTKNNNTKEIKKQELAAINKNDITLIQNTEEFKVAFTKQAINQTFEINESNTNSGDIGKILAEEIKTGSTKIENPEVAEELGIIDMKLIPTQAQTNQLYDILDPEFINEYTENMATYWKLGDKKNYNYYKGLLNKNIQKIYTAFGIKYTNLEIENNIQNLITELNSKYHIPNSQIDLLKSLRITIIDIENQQFGEDNLSLLNE